jgi:virginiamycin B lyase
MSVTVTRRRRQVRGRQRPAIALLCALVAVLLSAGSAHGALFWVNTDGESIGGANLGRTRASDVTQKLIATSGLDSGIAAGPDGYLYWSDTAKNRISRAHLYYDRRGRLRIALARNFITGADHPAGVAVYGGYIYWADSNQGSLARAVTATGADATQFITGLSDPRGVAVWGGHIYWANDIDHGSIGRANLDGTGVDNRFITGAPGPCMLTIADRHIYWSNSGYGTTASTIARANLDGSAVNERYVRGASSPCGVAVDSLLLRAPRHRRR